MRTAILLILLSCTISTQPFPREQFENTWWELEVYPICFNVHDDGLLTFEQQGPVINNGDWRYVGDNEYYIEGENTTLKIEQTDPPDSWQQAGACWKIKGYAAFQVFKACECTLIDY